MNCFFAELREERAQRNVSLEHIVLVTKVPLRHLLALEDGRIEDLPGGIFRKGILRSYLQVVGVDALLWMPRFELVLAELDAAAAAEPEQVAAAAEPNRAATVLPASAPNWSGVVFATMLLLAFGWCVWRFALRGHAVLSVVVPVSVRHAGAARGALPAAAMRRLPRRSPIAE